MAMAAALREASRCLASRGSPVAARPMLLAQSRGITYKLFIGGLSQFATEESLAEAFSRYGQIIEATVVRDKVTDIPKGFGFVKFASPEEANRPVRLNLSAKSASQPAVFSSHKKSASQPNQLNQQAKSADPNRANNAREEMNGKTLNGRVIYVDIAKAKPDRAANAPPIARGPPKPIGNDG